ncbi:MAG: hypothetical protein AMK72_08100 [Planctomycetes bacterium SM23_25]|nr:MAG: hypothetical protein AMK72_08100 [Planctomycetes bacterium SM23_25]
MQDTDRLPGDEWTEPGYGRRPLLYAGLVALCVLAAALMIVLYCVGTPDSDRQAEPGTPPQDRGAEAAPQAEPPPSPPAPPEPPPAPPQPEAPGPVRPDEPLLPPPDKAPPPAYPMGLKASDLRRWAFSPDGTALRPTAARNTTILDFAIGKTVRLTAEGEAVAWSPDSRWLLYWHRGWCYLRRDGKVNRRVFAHEDAGKTSPQYVGNLPLWHPDGPSLLVCDGERYRLVSVEGDRDRQIATAAEIPMGKRAGYADFSVGPEGTWIVYRTAKRVGFLRSDGSGHRAAVGMLYNCSPPVWSADGQSIVVLADVTEPRRAKQVWHVHLPSGHVEPICKRDPIRLQGGAWVGAVAPDAAWVAYVADDVDQPRIVLVDTMKRTLTKIHDGRDAGPLHVSPDGTWIAYASLSGERDVVVLSVDEPRGIRLRCPLLVERTVPVIHEWTADSRAVVFRGPGYTLCEVGLDGQTCRRTWPDVWDSPVDRTEFETNRVPLEKEDLVPCAGAFEPVKTAAEYLSPTAQDLPVQVVVED